MSSVVVEVRISKGVKVYAPKIGQRLARTGITFFGASSRVPGETRRKVEKRHKDKGHQVSFEER